MIPIKNKIYSGHVLDIIREWDKNIIDMCITSPPYWGLRDYETIPQNWGGDPNCDHDWKTTISNGLNGGPATKKMIVKGQIPERVSPTEVATCSKCGCWRGELGREEDFELFITHLCDIFDEVKRILSPHGTLWVNLDDCMFGNKGKINKLPKSCLTLIPYRFAIEMVKRGWILRNIIIWHKLQAKPESCTTRSTIDWEPIFFFTKKEKYYYRQQFERAKSQKDPRNMRSVWSDIKMSSYRHPHLAPFPEDLVRRPIKAGCPKEVCTKCGKPRKFIIKREKVGGTKSGGKFKNTSVQGTLQWRSPAKVLESYWSTCKCGAPFRKGVVFDPFMGSGTTGFVAKEMNRDFLGTELYDDNIEVAYTRINSLNKKEE